LWVRLLQFMDASLSAVDLSLWPRVGIVIPARNASAYLRGTIASVCVQTFTDWRCVIAENNSTDDTYLLAQELAEGDARISAVSLRGAGGVSDARNMGLEALDVGLKGSKCAYVIFLDADDLWTPDALATLVGLLEQRPDAPAAHATADFIGPDGLPIDARVFEHDPRLRLRYDGRGIVPMQSSADTTFESLCIWPGVITPGLVLMRWAAFEQVGKYDATLTHGEDWDLWLRLARYHGPLAYVDRALLHYRRHENNSASHGKRRTMIARVRQKIATTYADTPALKKYVRRAYAASYRMLARQRLMRALQEAGRWRIKSAGRLLIQSAVNLAMSLRKSGLLIC
jgi:glycosyltransferase involved in cell wall biosynthesis